MTGKWGRVLTYSGPALAEVGVVLALIGDELHGFFAAVLAFWAGMAAFWMYAAFRNEDRVARAEDTIRALVAAHNQYITMHSTGGGTWDGTHH